MKLGEVIVAVMPKPGAEGLGKVGLAGAELAPQADQVASPRDRGQGDPERCRGGGIGRFDAAFHIGGGRTSTRA